MFIKIKLKTGERNYDKNLYFIKSNTFLDIDFII